MKESSCTSLQARRRMKDETTGMTRNTNIKNRRVARSPFVAMMTALTATVVISMTFPLSTSSFSLLPAEAAFAYTNTNRYHGRSYKVQGSSSSCHTQVTALQSSLSSSSASPLDGNKKNGPSVSASAASIAVGTGGSNTQNQQRKGVNKTPKTTSLPASAAAAASASFAPPTNTRSKPVKEKEEKECNSVSVSTTTSAPSIISANEDGDDDVDFDWKSIAQSAFDGPDVRPVVLFDGICNLCHGGVNFALDHDSRGRFRFASLQSKVGQSLLLRSGKRHDDTSSIVLVTPTTSYFKSDAVIRIARMLDGPLSQTIGNVGPVFPEYFRNVIYDFVAQNRYRFGEHKDSCRLEDDRYDDRFVPDP